MSRYRAALFVSAIALLLHSAPARAGTLTAEDLMNMPLERLVKVEVLITGSSKYAEKVNEAPSVVEVITADDIHTYGYRTLGDVINGIHGVYISNDRQHTTPGVRGFIQTSASNSRLLVMIDGHRMNENVYDSAYVGREFMLDMDLVDHIEYIPGPGSSIYGANAMMGVINVVTKKGGDFNGTQVAVAGGSFKTGEARATYGKTLGNGTDVMMSASGYYSNGPENLFYPVFAGAAYTHFGYAHDLDAEFNHNLFAKVQAGNFTYTAGYVARHKDVPTGAFSTFFGEPGYYAVDRQGYGEVKYHNTFNEHTQVDVKSYYQWYDSATYWPYDCGAFICPYGSTYGGDWAGAEATFVTTAFNRQTIVFGGEFQYDISQRLLDDFFGVGQNSDNSGFRSGLYVQDAIKLRDVLVLNAGLRLDQHHLMKSAQINPRLGLIWNPKDTTTIKLLYGSAFRAPDVWETDYDFGGPATTPSEEHIKNYEAAVEWRDLQGLKLSGSLFYNSFTQMITTDFSVTNHPHYVNTGNLKSVGFEGGVEKKWDDGREFKLNFNHTEYLKFEGTNFGNIDSPKNVAKARYAQPLFDGRAKFGIEDVFVDKRLTLYYTTNADAYNLVNANITSSSALNDILPPGTDVSVGIYNLFNSAHEMTAGPPHTQDVIPMNGRNFLVTLRKTF